MKSRRICLLLLAGLLIPSLETFAARANDDLVIDLSVEKIAVSPEAVYVGQPEKIQVTIKNVGEATVSVSPCPAQIYVNGAPLGYACIQIAQELPPGSSMVQEADWMPDRPGQTTISARVQYGGDVNKQNNSKKLSVAVIDPNPVTDIAISGVTLSAEINYTPLPLPMASTKRRTAPTLEGNAVVGQSTRVDVMIENQGNQRVRLTNAEDIAVTVNGESLAQAYPFYPLDLYPGWVAYVAFLWTPSEPGAVTLTASVKTLNDGSYIPAETDIADNTFTSPVNVETARHDLAINSIGATSQNPPMYLDTSNSGKNRQSYPVPDPVPGPYPPAAAGEPSWIVVNVENQGNVWEKVVAIQITVNGEPLTVKTIRVPCMTTSADPNGAGCILPPMPGIYPGVIQSFYFSWTPPAKGIYEIGATVTPVEGETDTADNTNTAQVEITEERIHDMSLDAISVQDLELVPGSTVHLLLTMTNRGNVGEPYVSVDVSVNGRPYVYQYLGSFNAGETRTVQVVSKISRKVKPGTYTVKGTIPAVFGETNLDNNSASTTLILTPVPNSGPTGPPTTHH